jgi:hypothetical protein
MSYYAGDWYMGDPGFGTLMRAGIRSGMKRATPLLKRAGSYISKHPALTAAGTAIVGAGVDRVLGRMGASKVGPTGTPAAAGMARPRKMGGAAAPDLRVFRRRRRMRVTNPKALRRAIRRATGFARLAMRTIKIVYPRKKGRFGGWKVRKRK